MAKVYSEKVSLPLDKNTVFTLKTLQKAGFSAYVVGGAIRDLLLGKEVKDFDVATDATVEEIKKIFHSFPIICENGQRHGTVTVHYHKENIEITSFRHDEGETPCLESDLRHRDLTINSLAYNENGIIDLLGGLKDLEQGIIRFNEPIEKAINDDPLRILRALRFHVNLGFDIEPASALAMNALSFGLAKVAKERIKRELHTILLADDVGELLQRYKHVFFAVFPILSKMDGYDQTNPWHAHDLYAHTVNVVAKTKKDICLRLAALFHDIGKLETRKEETKPDGTIVAHYIGHPFHSKAMAEAILNENKVENAIRKKVLFLVEWHDVKIVPTRKSVGKMLQRIKSAFLENPYPILEDLFNLQKADILDHAKPIESFHEEVLALAKSMLEEGVPLLEAELAISGKALKHIGFEAEGIGRAKTKLLLAVIEGKIPNDREALYEYAQRLYKSGLR